MKLSNTRSLSVASSSSPTLNYLVFVQNVYLNRNQSAKQPKFPYLDSSSWRLLDDHFFCEQFKQSWEQAVDHFVTNGKYAEELIFSNREHEIFRRLFQNINHGDHGLKESFRSFMAWWNHGGSSYASTRLSDESMKIVYDAITARTESRSLDVHLKIELLYDEVQLSTDRNHIGYVVVPISKLEKLQYTGTIPEELLTKLLHAVTPNNH